MCLRKNNIIPTYKDDRHKNDVPDTPLMPTYREELLKLKVVLLEVKAAILKEADTGLAGPLIEDEPLPESMMKTFDEISGNEASDEKQKSPDELMEEIGLNSQISIDEAISAVAQNALASSAKASDVATKPSDENAAKAAAASDAVKKSDKASDQAQDSVGAVQMTLLQFKAWLTVRGIWKLRRGLLEYEYERSKAEVYSRCYGLDYAIDLIDKELAKCVAK